MDDRGLKRSLLLHAILLVLVIFGIPSLFRKEVEPVKIITVELVPILQITNVPKAEEAAKPKEEPKKEPPKPEKKAPPPPPPPVKEEPKPEPAPQAKKTPVEKPKEEPKKKPEKPKKKEKKLDFDSVLKTVEKIEKKQTKEEKKQEKKEKETEQKATAKNSSLFDPAQNLSISERDSIVQQISQCWSMPAGAKDAQNLAVMLHLSLEKDGTVRDVKMVDNARYENGDSFYRAAAESAMRAVKKCSPLKGLPKDKYETWKEIDMNFDPKEMLY